MGLVALLASSGCALNDSQERFVRFDGYVVDKDQNLAFVSPIDDTQRPFAEAETHCTGLTLAGVTDWRLPTLEEITNIRDESAKTAEDPPYVDTEAFPSTPCGPFWTQGEFDSASHWVIDFCSESGGSLANAASGWVRCASELAASKADL
ncbi:MAG: hypothetical protein A2289_24690 [Deltaproteobacteria bacterium RIFOXYA12_FULL_58_15]|nr:MAG: hypothetical protein A2289_24690 [Deltaproteobacteria bacterium RIFOXYA12_FULL_58_15]OGR12693.1 MAG: hypothetical protein A2341_07730 [Deltaproteobacteria bacterium RIFOXYB12_FULL_58_9]